MQKRSIKELEVLLEKIVEKLTCELGKGYFCELNKTVSLDEVVAMKK